MTEKISKSPQFGIVKQFLKDMSFECPASNLQISEADAKLEVSVGIQNKELDENHFEVSVYLNADAKHEDMQLFLGEVHYAGVFAAKDIPEEQLELLLGIEAPQLLFPFARGMLIRAIAESGCKVPQIEPVNFAHVFMKAKTQKPEAPEEQKKIEENKDSK